MRSTEANQAFPSDDVTVLSRALLPAGQWRWSVAAGVIIPLISWAFGKLVAEGLYYEVGRDLRDLVQILGEVGAPLLNATLTYVMAIWVTRQHGSPVIYHGVLIGVVSAGVGLVAALIEELPLDPEDIQGIWDLIMLLLTLLGGVIGGTRGRNGLLDREALFRLTRAIGVAGDPQTLVDAIGDYFAHSRAVMVALWQVLPPSDDPESQIVAPEFLLLASWVAKKILPPAEQMRIDAGRFPVLARLKEKQPFIFQVDELSAEERDAWVRLGARTLLLLPLTSSTDELIGVLMMNSQAAGGFARNIWRANLINTQVALALENIQLLEEAKQTAVLEERQRLAREIHDTIAQDFTSIVMHLEAAEQSLSNNLDTTHRHMDQARQTARDGLSQARQLVWALRPDILQREPLSVAVERVVTRWSEQNRVRAELKTTGNLMPLHPEVEVTLLRATQEALTNIRKHAQAGRVTVTLSYMGDLVALDVQDDGVGFDPEQICAQHTPRGLSNFGLTAMRERVEQLNGQLLIESAPGQGTTLVIKIPTPAGLQENHTLHPAGDGDR